jgi:hypothetical protein
MNKSSYVEKNGMPAILYPVWKIVKNFKAIEYSGRTTGIWQKMGRVMGRLAHAVPSRFLIRLSILNKSRVSEGYP